MATRSTINDEGGQAVQRVVASPVDTPGALAAALSLPDFRAVMVLADGAGNVDPLLRPRLAQLVGRGLLRAAREIGALCVAPGAGGGIAELIGQASADLDPRPLLLGVAAAEPQAVPGPPHGGEPGRPPPGLTHLALTPGHGAGSAIRARLDLAETLAAGRPVMMVVIAGGAGTAAEVLQAVRRRWPVLLVTGSGGAADELARQWTAGRADGDDPSVAEIVAEGNFDCLALGSEPGDAVELAARQVYRRLSGHSVLHQAWRRFAAIDRAAVRMQSDFMKAQWRIMALGVLAVFLAILQSQLKQAGPESGAIGPWFSDLLRFMLILVPITTSVFVAAAKQFKPGKRWVLLRTAAENIKREIYRYRLRTEAYAAETTRELNLSRAVEDITHRMIRTEANATGLASYVGPIPPPSACSPDDDGLSYLNADRYVRLRLQDQLAFYRGKSVKLERSAARLRWAVLLVGALGSLLAALGGPFVLWVALTTALANAFTSYLSLRQVEATLIGYNQAATDLENILSWWTALLPGQQAQRENVEALATRTERVLADELSGWAPDRGDQPDDTGAAGKADPGNGTVAPALPTGHAEDAKR